MLLSKIFQDILNFEKKFNKEREKHEKNMICFGCHKEEHIIHSCFLLFSHLKGTDGTSRQDWKDKFLKDGFKGKKKEQSHECNIGCWFRWWQQWLRQWSLSFLRSQFRTHDHSRRHLKLHGCGDNHHFQKYHWSHHYWALAQDWWIEEAQNSIIHP
jgi:hypothetical protein